MKYSGRFLLVFRPVTVQLVGVAAAEQPATELVATVYPVIALPPLFDGAFQLTRPEVEPVRVNFRPVGEPGTVAGVTGRMPSDEGPAPAGLVPITDSV